MGFSTYLVIVPSNIRFTPVASFSSGSVLPLHLDYIGWDLKGPNSIEDYILFLIPSTWYWFAMSFDAEQTYFSMTISSNTAPHQFKGTLLRHRRWRKSSPSSKIQTQDFLIKRHELDHCATITGPTTDTKVPKNGCKWHWLEKEDGLNFFRPYQ